MKDLIVKESAQNTQNSQNNSMFLSESRFAFAIKAAEEIAKSDIIPPAFQGKPANCLIAMELANRLDMSPIVIFQNLHVIACKPSFSASFVIAQINSSGRYKEPLKFRLDGEKDERNCTAYVIDHNGEMLEGPSISIGTAKAEGWYSRNKKWQTLPDLMLTYRAATFFGRIYVPELLMGMQTYEEIKDVGNEEAIRDITPKKDSEKFTEGINKIIEESKNKSNSESPIEKPIESTAEEFKKEFEKAIIEEDIKDKLQLKIVEELKEWKETNEKTVLADKDEWSGKEIKEINKSQYGQIMAESKNMSNAGSIMKETNEKTVLSEPTKVRRPNKKTIDDQFAKAKTMKDIEKIETRLDKYEWSEEEIKEIDKIEQEAIDRISNI